MILEVRFAKLQLRDFVEIISGKLLNSPSISFLGNITTNIANVKSGDIFIARNKNDIPSAVALGAYAIVSDSFVEIIDDEIAWIVVEDITNAMLKFIKYIKVVNKLEIYTFDKISFSIASKMIKHRQVRFASSVDMILEALFCKIIIIDFEILLFGVESIADSSTMHFRLLKQTLFESKIEYENKVYDVIIPSIFTKELSSIIYFFKSKHIDFSLSDEFFLPIFINSYGKSVKYGQSMRFVYATKDKKLLDKYLEFISSASWGRAVLLSNKKINKKIDSKMFNSKDELLEMFVSSGYHFFIVYGIEQDELSNMLSEEFIEQSLF